MSPRPGREYQCVRCGEIYDEERGAPSSRLAISR